MTDQRDLAGVRRFRVARSPQGTNHAVGLKGLLCNGHDAAGWPEVTDRPETPRIARLVVDCSGCVEAIDSFHV